MGKDGLAFQYLNSYEQKAYCIFENGFFNHKAVIEVSGVSSKIDMYKIVMAVISDNPEILYFDKSAMTTSGSLFSKKLSLTGVKSKSQYTSMENALKAAVEDAVFDIAAKAKNDMEIIQGISEYLQQNVLYDSQELESITKRRKSLHKDAHNAYGALIEKRAVCDGFASAFALIAREFGFRSMIIRGNAKRPNTRGKSTENHAWNIIEYNGDFYHIDTTWDSNMYQIANVFFHDYFMLCDDDIIFDHEWDVNYYPKCVSKKLSYYYRNDLIAYSKKDVDDIFNRSIRLGKKVIEVKLSGGIAYNDPRAEIAEQLSECILKNNQNVSINYIYNDATQSFIAKADF